MGSKWCFDDLSQGIILQPARCWAKGSGRQWLIDTGRFWTTPTTQVLDRWYLIGVWQFAQVLARDLMQLKQLNRNQQLGLSFAFTVAVDHSTGLEGSVMGYGLPVWKCPLGTAQDGTAKVQIFWQQPSSCVLKPPGLWKPMNSSRHRRWHRTSLWVLQDAAAVGSQKYRSPLCLRPGFGQVFGHPLWAANWRSSCVKREEEYCMSNPTRLPQRQRTNWLPAKACKS